jgi:acyl dehydratase
MPIDPSTVGNTSDPADFTWTSKDSLLYALGVGAGAIDPTGSELEFTTENSTDHPQRALPTQVVVLGAGRTVSFGDFNLASLLHGEQAIELHRPLAAEGSATSTSRVAAIYDKTKAAVVRLETTVVDADGNPWWTARTGLFISGEGGWGGERGPSDDWRQPERKPDDIVGFDTRTDQALLYRLSGDRNPLHSDPTFARSAGFDRPILHGLCTYGFTGRALLAARCGGDPDRFGTMGGRFRSPVLPGERLDVHMWDDADRVLFQTRVGDRVVFDGGVFTTRSHS